MTDVVVPVYEMLSSARDAARNRSAAVGDAVDAGDDVADGAAATATAEDERAEALAKANAIDANATAATAIALRIRLRRIR